MDLVVWDIENRPLNVLRDRLTRNAISDFALITAWAKSYVPKLVDVEGVVDYRHLRVEAGPDAADEALLTAAFSMHLSRTVDRTIIVSGDKIFYRLQSRLASMGRIVIWDDVENASVPLEVIQSTQKIVKTPTWTPERAAAHELTSTPHKLRTNPIGLLLESLSPQSAQLEKADAARVRLSLVMDGLVTLETAPLRAYVGNARSCNLFVGIEPGTEEDRLSQMVARFFGVSASADSPFPSDTAAKMLYIVADVLNRRRLLDADAVRKFASAPRDRLPHASLLLQVLGNTKLLNNLELSAA